MAVSFRVLLGITNLPTKSPARYSPSNPAGCVRQPQHQNQPAYEQQMVPARHAAHYDRCARSRRHPRRY